MSAAQLRLLDANLRAYLSSSHMFRRSFFVACSSGLLSFNLALCSSFLVPQALAHVEQGVVQPRRPCSFALHSHVHPQSAHASKGSCSLARSHACVASFQLQFVDVKIGKQSQMQYHWGEIGGYHLFDTFWTLSRLGCPCAPWICRAFSRVRSNLRATVLQVEVIQWYALQLL